MPHGVHLKSVCFPEVNHLASSPSTPALPLPLLRPLTGHQHTYGADGDFENRRVELALTMDTELEQVSDRLVRDGQSGPGAGKTCDAYYQALA